MSEQDLKERLLEELCEGCDVAELQRLYWIVGRNISCLQEQNALVNEVREQHERR